MKNDKTEIEHPQNYGLIESLPDLLTVYQKYFAEFPVGSNILFDFGNELSLLKYESCDLKVMDHNTHSYNRNVNIMAFDQEDIEFLQELSGLRPKSNKPRKIVENKDREVHKLQANVLGTHLLDFTWDPEFNVYLPSSDGRDLFMNIASEMGDGRVVLRNENISFTADPLLVTKRLREITRPKYFEEVIMPFLESRPTRYQMPGRKKFGFYEWLLKRQGKLKSPDAMFREAVKKLQFGDFLYVGSKEEVYCLCLPKENKGLYRQGTYTTSTKPILYFSNNFLEFVSCWQGKNPYHDHGRKAPEMAGKPFIFPQIGRSQDCKNTIWTGQPECITGDVGEAVDHFKTTDFAEFSDTVEQYGRTPHFIHPDLEKIRNGKYFF